MDVPETRYAKTADGVHIAYQVLGDGPVDLVYVGPWVIHLEYRWELPRYASYLRRIASFSRLILFDKRGFGLSDPVPPDELPNLETRMDDLRAVMDAVGSDRAVIYGASESGMLDLLFAATYPERTLVQACFDWLLYTGMRLRVVGIARRRRWRGTTSKPFRSCVGESTTTQHGQEEELPSWLVSPIELEAIRPPFGLGSERSN